ncbi:hypothetical protein AB7203_21605, partial [Providencia alcalifaciens]
DYHQTNQKTNTGKTLKPWPILVDHYTALQSGAMRMIDFVKYLQSINIIPQDEKAEDVIEEIELSRASSMM